MKRSRRLNRKEQFLTLYRSGIRVDAGPFLVLYRENRFGKSRFAVVVQKRFGSAVARNKAKRKARILFDRFQEKISPPCDVLILPKKGMLLQTQNLLMDRFQHAFERGPL